jgi:hypothetical protein
MSAAEELDALVQSMLAEEPTTDIDTDDDDSTGDVAWKVSYSTFRN